MKKNYRYESTRGTYNKIAKAWSEKNFKTRKVIGEMRIFRNYIKKGGRILDAGSGPGRDARKFISRGYEVIGVDFSKVMINQAKLRVPDGDFRLMDMKKLKFGNSTFDGIWCLASLLHIEKKDAPNVMKGFMRVLKPGGILAVSVKQGTGERLEEWEAGFEGKRFFSYYSQDELYKLLKGAGFGILQTRIRHLKDDWIFVFAKAAK